MMILALEFSSNLRSVAVFDSGSHNVLASVSEKLGRTTGMALIDETMRRAALESAAINRIAVGLGPGSYSGVRSSIAIAQGWQLARDVEVAGISSSDCLADTAKREGLRGEFTVAIDAQRGDVYRARYALSESGWRQIDPLVIVPASSIANGSSVIGPDATNLFPSAESLARLASRAQPVLASSLEPIYLREASFVKAPAPRNY